MNSNHTSLQRSAYAPEARPQNRGGRSWQRSGTGMPLQMPGCPQNKCLTASEDMDSSRFLCSQEVPRTFP